MCNVTKHIISDMIWPNLRTNLCVYLDSNLAPRGKKDQFSGLETTTKYIYIRQLFQNRFFKSTTHNDPGSILSNFYFTVLL